MTPRFTSNLQALRLIAAYLVLFRHSFVILGEMSPLAGVRLMPIGIWVFFAISGYLLPSSWERNPRPIPYARARFLRLFPAFAVVVLFSAFVIGPIFTTIPREEYFLLPHTWSYLLNLVLHPMYSLPEVFANNYYPHAVNGSIWSIPPQVLTYALVPLVFLVRRRWLRVTAWGLIFALTQWDHATGLFDETIIWGTDLSQALTAIALFAAGALVRETRVKLHLGIALGLLILLIVVQIFNPSASYPLLALTLPYVVITIGLRSWPLLREANRLPDISYGVFLLGFPVQQSIIAAAPLMNPWLSIMLAAIISTIGALLLERFVERPIAARSAKWSAASRK